MAVPPNSITRLSLQYTVGGVNCVTSVHGRNDAVLTQTQWVDDVQDWGPLFFQRFRVLQSTAVTYQGAHARVLGHPELPSAGFSGGGTGSVASPTFPALTYVQMDMRTNAFSAAGRRRKNAVRIAGIAQLLVNDNAMMESDIVQFKSLWGSLMSTLWSGHAGWLWVAAYDVTRTSANSAVINGVNMKGSVRVLSSRQR